MSRTHQEIGVQQKLFFSDVSSAGSPFFMPHGAHIYNKLQELLRTAYQKSGYQEVITPNIAHVDLWKRSGHYDKYRQNMFLFNISEGETSQQFGLKGMNCPFHCVMFNRFGSMSYRQLPLRLADFGALHRNELSGALVGLTRVRRFAQDDAHIFCRREDLQSEIESVLQFMFGLYDLFNFTDVSLELSTRPAQYIGELTVWNKAESILETVLENSGKKWSLNPADGAFYGPKIDVKLKDSLGRSHQCGTIQLDFNLPERFDLKYQDEHEELQRPVMIHRAVLGSFERFIAILAEHVDGRWPFWLSPRQIEVVPLTPAQAGYAQDLTSFLTAFGFRASCDSTDRHFKKKIRDAERLCTNHILVVGAKEAESNGVNLRAGGEQKYYKWDEYCMLIKELGNACSFIHQN